MTTRSRPPVQTVTESISYVRSLLLRLERMTDEELEAVVSLLRGRRPTGSPPLDEAIRLLRDRARRERSVRDRRARRRR